MPFDPATGQWKTEDASVEPRVTSLVASNNPLIAQARQQGLAASNRRGLINSSIAVGASQGEAYKVALPIAQQDAAQVQQSNLAEQDRVSQGQRQTADIAAQMDRLRTQAGFTSALQGASDTAQMERLRASGDISGTQQAAQIAATAAQQRVQGEQNLAQITATGQVQSGLNAQQGEISASLSDRNNAAEYARLQASLAQSTAAQATDIRAQMDRLQASSQANLAQLAASAGYQSQQIAQQGTIQASLQDHQNAAEYARLETSLAAASATQRVDIQAQMDRLQASSQANLAQLAAQNTYALGQNAQQAGFQQQLTTLQGNIQSALQASGAAQQQALVRVQGDIQSTLQSQANDQQLTRMAAEFANQAKVQAVDQTNALARLQMSGDQTMAQLASQQTAELQKLSMNLAQQDRQAVAASVVTIFQQEANMRAALLANTAIPAAERSAYEAAIARLGDPARAFINQLYGGNAGSGSTAAPITTPATGLGSGVETTPVGAGGGLNNGGAVPATTPLGNLPAYGTTPNLVQPYVDPNLYYGGGLNAGGALGGAGGAAGYSTFPVAADTPGVGVSQQSANVPVYTAPVAAQVQAPAYNEPAYYAPPQVMPATSQGSVDAALAAQIQAQQQAIFGGGGGIAREGRVALV